MSIRDACHRPQNGQRVQMDAQHRANHPDTVTPNKHKMPQLFYYAIGVHSALCLIRRSHINFYIQTPYPLCGTQNHLDSNITTRHKIHSKAIFNVAKMQQHHPLLKTRNR
ncbi:MAG: hypothetical protein Q4A74_00280 [Cardiobacteriaceae bacterium]|nr:hypothetical protein [Cardiobacteriaceae bacterium]